MGIFKTRKRYVGLLVILLLPLVLYSQEKDTTVRRKDSVSFFQNIKSSRLGKELTRSITTRSFADTLEQERSEDKLMPYQGKIIRKIYTDHIGFDRSIYNPQKDIKTFAARAANSLHSDTRTKIIRQHLFFYEGRPLNPYKLADNERYLRDLDFILDSRIVVDCIDNTDDSVDVHVITRDVFSLGGHFSPDPDKIKFGLYDANFLGEAQRLETTMLFEPKRSPMTGVSSFYRKSSFMGSLTNVTFGYTQLDNARSIGTENEYAYYLQLDRPLVSPYSRWAGGVELSNNWSKNVHVRADSLFLHYRYNVQDYWAGYNIGVRNNMNDRTRHFIAMRYFQQRYLRLPEQENVLNTPIYSDRQMLVGAVTFYEQNFYKTRFVYGFGRTEDIPYGTHFTITSGWTKEMGIERPYLAADLSKSIVQKSGHFYSLRAAAGGYKKKDQVQDAVVLITGNFYSKLLTHKKIKIRQSLEFGYAQMFHPKTNYQLTINNLVKGFSPDSLYGARRIYAHSETIFYTTWSFLGFRFAPFTSFEGGLFLQKELSSYKNSFYPGFSTGVRTRNENLVFGTMEWRVYYFPITVKGVSTFEFKFSTNLRIKYSGGFVNSPGLLVYN